MTGLSRAESRTARADGARGRSGRRLGATMDRRDDRPTDARATTLDARRRLMSGAKFALDDDDEDVETGTRTSNGSPMGTFRLGASGNAPLTGPRARRAWRAIAVVMAVLVVVLLFGMPLRAWTNG